MVGRPVLSFSILLMPMRLATIDIGTNTAQLLVAERDQTGLHRLHTAERFVRLGEGVDARGRIGPEARERLLDTLRDHLQVARAYGVDQLSAAGTSALRDAANRDAVLASVRDTLGLSVDLLSGTEEATWSYAAACAAFDNLSGPRLVVDVGGGSTELIVGTDPARPRPSPTDAIQDHASLDLGCVRLTERCFASQPPSHDAVETVDQIIDEALAARAPAVGDAPTLIGTAGTATALALVHAGPDSTGDALHGDGVVLSSEDIRCWRERLLRQTVDEIFELHPEAMEGRADVFPMGVILLGHILAHYELEDLRVSPYELRHGLTLRLRASAPAPSS